jgi:endonuclease-3 related protein
MGQKTKKNYKKIFKEMYLRLYSAFGPQHWWPGDTPFEVAVGAILTQNTNWANVEKAINNLKFNGHLSAHALHEISIKKLASLIRPAGYFNIKAKRLKAFIDFLMRRYRGSMKRMALEDTEALRESLLSINGIGPETADSILLYALDRPVFVIDAYTKRVLERHNLIHKNADYHEVQSLFSTNLKKDTYLFNEYHALFVRVGKEFCKPIPRCKGCALKGFEKFL